MKILVVGLGYVGMSTALWLCEKGHSVFGIDINDAIYASIASGTHLTDEPQVRQLTNKHLNRCFFANTSVLDKNKYFDLVVVASMVGNLEQDSQNTSLRAVSSALHANEVSFGHVVIKSTLYSANDIDLIFGNNVAVVPEFLRQGHAFDDISNPQRIIIGTSNPDTLALVKTLYSGATCPILEVSAGSAVMGKLASNSMLAIKAAFANEMANAINSSEDQTVDIDEVAAIMSSDCRIGPSHLSPSIGIGGSCLPKDVAALNQFMGGSELLSSVAHWCTPDALYSIWLSMNPSLLKSDCIVILGAGFKPESSDSRFTPLLGIDDRINDVYVIDPRKDPASTVTDFFIYDSVDALEDVRADSLVVNTDDFSLLAEAIEKLGPSSVYDPHNLLTDVMFALMAPAKSKIKLIKNGKSLK